MARIQTQHALFREAPIEQYASISRIQTLSLMRSVKFSKTPDKYFPYIRSLELTMMARLVAMQSSFEQSPWDGIHPMPTGTACYLFYHEYIAWVAEQDPTIVQGRFGTELMREMMDSMEDPYMSTTTTERSKQAVIEIIKLGISPNQQTLITDYKNRTIWVLLLQRITRNGPTAHQWSAIEAMLEQGAHPPRWTRFKEPDMWNRLLLKVGDEEVIIWHDLKSEYMPVCLATPGGTATLWDFIDKYEDDTYNRDFIRDLLRKAGQDRPGSVKSPSAEVAKLLQTWRNASARSFQSGSWAKVNNVMTNPFLPWLIIGKHVHIVG